MVEIQVIKISENKSKSIIVEEPRFKTSFDVLAGCFSQFFVVCP